MPGHHLPFMGLDEDPICELKAWVKAAQDLGDPYFNAMCLSTVGENAAADARMVLLKEVEENKLVFFTNFDSKKGQDITAHPQVCLNFFWPQLGRQLRVRGSAQKISRARSEAYFQERPRGSQVSAWVSQQSHKIPDRTFLEQLSHKFTQDWQGKEIACPPNWGGLEVSPLWVEFWLADAYRLHSRVAYEWQNGQWQRFWLAP